MPHLFNFIQAVQTFWIESWNYIVHGVSRKTSRFMKEISTINIAEQDIVDTDQQY